MSAHKHTPGPWVYTKAAVTGDRGIRADGTGIFAEAFADIRRAGENNADEAEANARLIAASPDLLAALENLEIAATGAGVPHAQERKLLGDAIIAARAAIAKATGAA